MSYYEGTILCRNTIKSTILANSLACAITFIAVQLHFEQENGSRL